MHDSEVAIPYFYANLFFDAEKDIQGFRKAMVGELFILFMMYFANLVRVYLTHPERFKDRNQQVSRNDDGKPREQAASFQKVPFLLNLEYLEERFAIYFMHHTVALAMSLIWAPYEFELAITYIHLGVFVGYIIGEMKEIAIVQNVCYGFMIVINLLLILAGLVNLGSLKI